MRSSHAGEPLRVTDPQRGEAHNGVSVGAVAARLPSTTLTLIAECLPPKLSTLRAMLTDGSRPGSVGRAGYVWVVANPPGDPEHAS